MNAETKQTLEEYDQIFKEIFKDLINEGNNIEVEFSNAKEMDVEPEFTMTLVSVNECKTPIKFESKLFLISNKAFLKLKQLDNINRYEFYHFTLINLKLLEDLIWKRKTGKNNKILTLFSDYKLKDDKENIYDEILHIDYIDHRFLNDNYFFKDLSHYGEIWQKTLGDLKIKINNLINKNESKQPTLESKSLINEIKEDKEKLKKSSEQADKVFDLLTSDRIINIAINNDPELKTALKNLEKKEQTNAKEEVIKLPDIEYQSYKLVNNDAHLKKIINLYQKLKSKNFIDKETKSENFKAIFTGTVKQQVNWISKGGLTEILYLFYNLWGDNEGTTQYLIKPGKPYQNLKNCFKINGKIITKGAFRTLYNQIINEEKLPSRAGEIDVIIKSLK